MQQQAERNERRYSPSKEIGRGGFGIIYQAEYQGKKMCIKRPKDGSDKEKARQELELELRIMQQIEDQRFVKAMEVEEDKLGPFLVMELVEGESLGTKLARLRTEGGFEEGSEMGTALIPYEEALRIGLELAKAMLHAHGKGVIHKDIKPSNILITKEGDIKITDLGSAKRVDQEKTGTVTLGSAATSDIEKNEMDPEERNPSHSGTPCYLTFRARKDPVNPRTDIEQIMITLAEMLGRNPRTPVIQLEFPSSSTAKKLDKQLLQVWNNVLDSRTGRPLHTMEGLIRELQKLYDKEMKAKQRIAQQVERSRSRWRNLLRLPTAREFHFIRNRSLIYALFGAAIFFIANGIAASRNTAAEEFIRTTIQEEDDRLETWRREKAELEFETVQKARRAAIIAGFLENEQEKAFLAAGDGETPHIEYGYQSHFGDTEEEAAAKKKLREAFIADFHKQRSLQTARARWTSDPTAERQLLDLLKDGQEKMGKENDTYSFNNKLLSRINSENDMRGLDARNITLYTPETVREWDEKSSKTEHPPNAVWDDVWHRWEWKELKNDERHPYWKEMNASGAIFQNTAQFLPEFKDSTLNATLIDTPEKNIRIHISTMNHSLLSGKEVTLLETKGKSNNVFAKKATITSSNFPYATLEAFDITARDTVLQSATVTCQNLILESNTNIRGAKITAHQVVASDENVFDCACTEWVNKNRPESVIKRACAGNCCPDAETTDGKFSE